MVNWLIELLFISLSFVKYDGIMTRHSGLDCVCGCDGNVCLLLFVVDVWLNEYDYVSFL